MTTRAELLEVLQEALDDPAQAEAALEALVAAYGGERVYIPLRRPVERSLVRFAAYLGHPPAEVAEAHRISLRTFRRIVRES